MSDAFAVHHWASVRAQLDEAPTAIMRAVIESKMPPEPTNDDLQGLETLYPGLWTQPRTLLSCASANDSAPHEADDDDDGDFNTNSQDPVIFDVLYLTFWFLFAACWLLLLFSVVVDYYPGGAKWVLVRADAKESV